MPTYEITLANGGKYRISAEGELSAADLDESAAELEAAEGSTSSSPTASPRSAASVAPQNGEPDGGNFFDRVGRRVMEAGRAALDIPSSAAGLVTGSAPEIVPDEKMQGLDFLIASAAGKPRVQSALRLLQGLSSPVSILTSPVEGAVEYAAKGFGANEAWARLAGDVGGAASTLGLGLLAKAGKLGTTATSFAKAVGAGRPTDLAEQLRHDPHLKFIASQDVGESLSREGLEGLIRRGDVNMEELALAAKSPKMAQMMLEEKLMKSDAWLEHAKTFKIVDELPPEPRFSPVERIAFAADNKRDMTILGTLGTPTNVAARINPKAGAMMFELAQAEQKMQQGTAARGQRNDAGLLGVGDKDVAMAVRGLREGATADPATPWGRALTYLQQKFQVDKEAILPKLREQYAGKFQKLALEEWKKQNPNKEVDSVAVGKMAEEMVTTRIPNETSMDTLLALIHPGEFKILDKEGNFLGMARTKLDAKMEIRGLVLAGHDPKDIQIKSKAVFDTSLLGSFKGRVAKGMENLAKGMEFDPEEVMKAAGGDIHYSKPFKFLGGDTSGKGYTKDLLTTLSLYDRGVERWSQLNEVLAKVNPEIAKLREHSPNLARMIAASAQSLWGHKHPLSQWLDSSIAATPLLNTIIPPGFLERSGAFTKAAMVNMMLRFTPKYHGLNFTQTAATLWPIVESADFLEGRRLALSAAGKAILKQHMVQGSKLDAIVNKLGPIERMNQERAFLTMYNKARKLGFDDQRAASYSVLRGNLYSQFLGLTVDTPYAWRKFDPVGLMTMFQRFPVKQYEQLLDMVKDRNFPAAAKWLTVNLALGGFKAATMGHAGYLSLKVYKELEKEYGKPVADLFHIGLPGLAGIDLSGSVQLWNAPFGDNLAEKIGNLVEGPVGSLVSSVVGAASNSAGPEPSAIKRAFDALTQRVPLAKEANAVVRLFEGNYEFKDPIGRLRYKGDVKDVVKRLLGFRTAGGRMGTDDMRDAELDTFASALMEVREERDQVLDYVASRHGQATLAGVDLGEPMKEMLKKQVDQWNAMFPEFPITGSDIMNKAKYRQETAVTSLRERLLKGSPKVMRRSETFGDPAKYENTPKIPFGGG